MDGYYQETGRAGRDGLDADCVLYFRHQDATRWVRRRYYAGHQLKRSRTGFRVLALTLGEIDGSDKGELKIIAVATIPSFDVLFWQYMTC